MVAIARMGDDIVAKHVFFAKFFVNAVFDMADFGMFDRVAIRLPKVDAASALANRQVLISSNGDVGKQIFMCVIKQDADARRLDRYGTDNVLAALNEDGRGVVCSAFVFDGDLFQCGSICLDRNGRTVAFHFKDDISASDQLDRFVDDDRFFIRAIGKLNRLPFLGSINDFLERLSVRFIKSDKKETGNEQGDENERSFRQETLSSSLSCYKMFVSYITLT